MATTRSQDDKIEAARKALLTNLTAEWQVGYVNIGPDFRQPDYVYVSKCPTCRDVLISADPHILIHLALAHYNKCWEDRIKEMYRKEALRQVKLEPYMILISRTGNLVEYLCNHVDQNKMPCEYKSLKAEVALFHLMSHYWPASKATHAPWIYPLTDFTPIDIGEILREGVMCDNCMAHLTNQAAVHKHLPCPYDEMALESDHDVRPEQLWFECDSCHDLFHTLPELEMHRESCELSRCASCLRVWASDTLDKHDCHEYTCNYCAQKMAGVTTFKHKCAEGRGLASSYSKDPLLSTRAVGDDTNTNRQVTFNPTPSVREVSDTNGSSTPLDKTDSTGSPPESAKKAAKQAGADDPTVSTPDTSLTAPSTPSPVVSPQSGDTSVGTNTNPRTENSEPRDINDNVWGGIMTSNTIPNTVNNVYVPSPTPRASRVNQSNPTITGALSSSTPKSRLATQWNDSRSGRPAPITISRRIFEDDNNNTSGGIYGTAMNTRPTYHPSDPSRNVTYTTFNPVVGNPISENHRNFPSPIKHRASLPPYPHGQSPGWGQPVSANGAGGGMPPSLRVSGTSGGMHVGGQGDPPPNPDPEYRCRYCHTRFPNLQDLARHEKECIYNPDNHVKPMKCPICHFVVTGVFELEEHIRRVHSQQEMICAACHRNVFRDVSEYLLHIATHSDTLTEAFQQIQRAQNPNGSLYSATEAQVGSFSQGISSRSYSCKLCFAQMSRDDLYFEHYSMHQCPGLTGMNGDINARASPLNPPRRFNRDSYHDRKKLEALCCLQDVSLMNKAVLVDVLTAITYQQTVSMPEFGTNYTRHAKETEVNTLRDLKINTQDPLDSALQLEDFLKKLVSFIETISMSEEKALQVLKRKVGPNLLHTLEQFCMKWNTVAIGAIPFFVPCSFLELTYMCAASPRLAKLQLADMKMLAHEGPTELLNRIMRLCSLATKELPHDLKCYQAEELAFNAFLKALPPKCKRILMNEQSLREKLNQEPIGAMSALQLIQKRISSDTILLSERPVAMYAFLGKAGGGQNGKGQKRNDQKRGKGPTGKKLPNWYSMPADSANNAPRPNQQSNPGNQSGNQAQRDALPLPILELIKIARVKSGECIKCGGNNHRQHMCRTFPGPVSTQRCKFHRRFLHFGRDCPLNPAADEEAKKRKCFLSFSDAELDDLDKHSDNESDQTEEPSAADFAGMTISDKNTSVEPTVMSAYHAWVNSTDDE